MNHYYPFGALFGEGVQTSNQPYKYNGKELDRVNGLDMYDYGARHYDATLGSWFAVDPLAEKYYSWTPYVYCLNNPVKYTDPDGKNPVLGALVGGLMDYGIQVASNYMTGTTGPEAWTKVDLKSIAVSAGSGAVGVGLATKANQVIKLAKLGKTATQVAKVAGEAAVDAGVSAASQLIEDGEVSLGQTAIDTGGGAFGSNLGDKVKAAKQASTQGKTLSRQADRAQRLTKSGNSRQSRIESAQNATKKAESYGNNQAAATSTATSTTISKTNEQMIEKNDNKKNK